MIGPETLRRNAASGALLIVGVEFTILLLGLFALKLAAGMGAEGFAVYAVARRVLQVLAFPVLLGTGIAIPRFVAESDATGGDPRAYLIAALALVTPLLSVLAVVMMLAPGVVERIAFGPDAGAGMAAAIAVAMFGLCLHALAYSYLRGQMQWRRTAVLQVFNVGIVPVLALLLSETPGMAVFLTGAGWCLISALVLVALLRGRLRVGGLASAVNRLLVYGLPRVPGELALFGLFALPVILVTHTHGLVTAGYLSLGLSVLGLVTSLHSSLGVVLLPYVSQLLARGEAVAAQRVVGRTLLGGVTLAVAVAVVATPLMPRIVARFLGPDFAPAITTVRVLLWASVPYVVYAVLRSPLDALRTWPHNSINLSLGLVVICTLIWAGGPALSPPVAVFAGLTVIAAGSLVSWWRCASDLAPVSALEPAQAP